jgi:hypothetical protein
MNNTRIAIALNPTQADAVQYAQRLADTKREPYGVWEHVGLYGQLGGDEPARHSFKVRALSQADPSNAWALVACVDPE